MASSTWGSRSSSAARSCATPRVDGGTGYPPAMRSGHSTRRRAWALGLLGTALVVAGPGLATQQRKTAQLAPMRTGFADPWVLSGDKVVSTPYLQTKTAGASFVRIYTRWNT